MSLAPRTSGLHVYVCVCVLIPFGSLPQQNNVMPNGEANITNNVLEMMHADRHTVGHYKCTADNRVGQPDQRDIFVNVLCECAE